METKEKIIIVLSCLLLLIDFCVVFFLNLNPIIHLKEGDITLELKEPYIEPGYSASKGYFDVTDQIVVSNNINVEKIGTYQVVYQIKQFKKNIQKKRKVKVVDKTPPSLELKGSEKITLCPKQEYQEEGYESIDNYDGNLTEKVEKKVTDHSILYSIKDQSGNITEKERILEYKDEEAPTITLNGNAYSLYVGESYIETGYSAFDNCDLDITDKVKIESNVNTNQKGTYQITYSVTDSSSHTTSVTRTVLVLGKKPSNGKKIYLTFDDGPSSNITPGLLDILKEEGVKATFFVLNRDSSLDYLIKREYNEGHTVALHGSSHNYKQIYSSSLSFWNDMDIIQKKVESLTGEKPMIIRFPGGSSNTISKFNPGIMTTLTLEAKQKGFHYFDWNIGSGDSGEVHTKEAVYQNVIKSLGNKNNIVLMHDFSGNYKTLNAIRDIIRYGKNNGYTFERITLETEEMHHRVAN